MAHRPVPARKRITAAVAVVLVPVLLFFICYTFFSLRFSAQNSAHASRSVLEATIAELESNLNFIDNEMGQRVATDPYFQYLCKKQSRLDAFLFMEEFQRKNTELMNISGIIGAMGVYSGANNLFRPYTYSGMYEVAHKELLLQAARSLAENGAQHIDDGWMPRHISGGNYLFRVLGRTTQGHATYMVCAVDLDRWSADRNAPAGQQAGGAVLVCRSAENDILTGAAWLEQRGVALRDGPPAGAYYLAGAPPCMVVEKTAVLAGIELVRLTAHNTFGGGNQGEVMMLLFALLLVFTVPVAYWLLRRSFIVPLEEMTRTMQAIAGGDVAQQMRESFPVNELNTLASAFNTMVRQIGALKIEAYEKVIRARELQLQYLQIQINPHFFLNCLKSLYGLSQENDRGRMQDMIISFSEYVRGVLRADVEDVTVAEELRSIKNYVELLRLSASTAAACAVEVDDALLDMRLPPLSLLTFVENSLRHGTTPGRAVQVQVRGRLLHSPEGDFASFLVSDDGRGFTEEMLAWLNRPAALSEPTRESHIGIDNVKKRMLLMYGSGAAISFYNRPGGASVELYIALPAGGAGDEEAL